MKLKVSKRNPVSIVKIGKSYQVLLGGIILDSRKYRSMKGAKNHAERMIGSKLHRV
jgi:hypothetical protein